MKLGIIIAAAILFAVWLYFLLEVWFPQLLISLANKDRGFSPIRMRPSSGQYAIISWGDSSGPMAKIIHDIPGHYLDDHSRDQSEWTFVRGEEPREEDRGGYLDKLGIVWVGFNKAYYRQKTEYNVWDKLPNSTEYGLVAKVRNASADDPYYYFQYAIAVKAEGVETNVENFPVDMTVVLTVRHRQPVKTLFFAGRWPMRAAAAAEAVMRQYGGSRSFDNLRAETAQKQSTQDSENLITQLKRLGDPNPMNPDESLTKKFGIEIDDPEFVSMEITPGSQAAKIAEATASVGVAQKNNEAATARAESIRKEYEARREAGGEHAGTFALAEAIKENKTASTLVIGSTNIAVPSK